MITEDKLTTAEVWTQATASDVTELLNEMQISAEGMAQLLGVSTLSVQRWANGKIKIPYASWALMCLVAGKGDIIDSDYYIKGLERKIDRNKKYCLKYSQLLKKKLAEMSESDEQYTLY